MRVCVVRYVFYLDMFLVSGKTLWVKLLYQKSQSGNAALFYSVSFRMLDVERDQWVLYD